LRGAAGGCAGLGSRDGDGQQGLGLGRAGVPAGRGDPGRSFSSYRRGADGRSPWNRRLWWIGRSRRPGRSTEVGCSSLWHRGRVTPRTGVDQPYLRCRGFVTLQTRVGQVCRRRGRWPLRNLAGRSCADGWPRDGRRRWLYAPWFLRAPYGHGRPGTLWTPSHPRSRPHPAPGQRHARADLPLSGRDRSPGEGRPARGRWSGGGPPGCPAPAGRLLEGSPGEGPA